MNDIKINFKAPIKRNKASNLNTNYEDINQQALVKWARILKLPLISIPNQGKRSFWLGKKERSMGLTAGVSDLFLALPNKYYHGFWIEMKRKGEKPKPNQLIWLNKMQFYGYKADWFDDWEEAKKEIESYLLNIM